MISTIIKQYFKIFLIKRMNFMICKIYLDVKKKIKARQAGTENKGQNRVDIQSQARAWPRRHLSSNCPYVCPHHRDLPAPGDTLTNSPVTTMRGSHLPNTAQPRAPGPGGAFTDGQRLSSSCPQSSCLDTGQHR